MRAVIFREDSIGMALSKSCLVGREVALSVSEAVKKLLLTHPSQTDISEVFCSMARVLE